MGMLTTSQYAVLRPRELVVELFACALDGDSVAEDDLEALASHDARADAALDAIAVADVESCFRTDPDGRDVAPVPPGLLERALAAVDAVHRDGDLAAALGTSRPDTEVRQIGAPTGRDDVGRLHQPGCWLIRHSRACCASCSRGFRLH